MEGIRGGLPPGSLSLSPTFALWAALAAVLLLIAFAIGWLVRHGPLQRTLGRLWLGDVVAAWLAYAALYHLAFLGRLRPVLDGAPALWLLCAALAAYALLRLVPSPLRRPPLLFALAIIAWGGVLAAGQRYVDETAADAALLAGHPEAVLNPVAPNPEPLRRALLLTRLAADTRDATQDALAHLEGRTAEVEARGGVSLAVFRAAYVPVLLEHYTRDLAKLRTYQWMQAALLLAVLLVWAFGTVPDWETL